MAKFGELTRNQEEDILSKVNSAAGGNGIVRFQADELVIIEKERKVSIAGLANGGVSYAVTIDVDAFRRDWERHFLKVYDMKVDLSGIKLPPLRQGFGWGVVRLPELSAQQMFEVLTRRFNGKTWKWCRNIDEALNAEFEVRTTANGPYVTWYRDRVEADEELKKLSANDLVERGTNCITEPERIALEGWFEEKTGGHLDIKNVTLSVGSRGSDGGVPTASWSADGGFCVFGYGVDYRRAGLRAREAVSL